MRIEVFCDNQSVVTTTIQPNNNSKNRDRVFTNCLSSLRRDFNSGVFVLDHIEGNINPADLFTKPLPNERFTFLMQSPLICSCFKWKQTKIIR